MNRLTHHAETRNNRQQNSCTPWRKCFVAAFCLVLLFSASPATAGILFSESFDTEVSGVSPFLAAYPDFGQIIYTDFGGTPFIEVPSEKILHLSGGGTNFGVRFFSGIPNWSQISLKIGRINVGPAVSGNVGLVVGDNTILFHPGYTSDDGLVRGAIRVDGPDGFFNRDAGFLPESDVLHELTVTNDGLGNFEVILTDGLDPNNSFSKTWFNPGALFSPISLWHRDKSSVLHEAIFDDILILDFTPIPEPSTLVLGILGLLGLWIRRLVA